MPNTDSLNHQIDETTYANSTTTTADTINHPAAATIFLTSSRSIAVFPSGFQHEVRVVQIYPKNYSIAKVAPPSIAGGLTGSGRKGHSTRRERSSLGRRAASLIV